MTTTKHDEAEARALRAAGVPITLLDGREVRLIFDLDAMAQIEEDFGSLGGMQDTLIRIEKEGAHSAFFLPVLKMMRAALLHDPSARDARFDTALVGDYFKAVMSATRLAFPKDESATTPTSATTVMTTVDTSDFPGRLSTTPQPSSSEETTAPSGA